MPNAKAKLPGPPASTLKRGKPGWRPRSAPVVGSARIIYDIRFSFRPYFLTSAINRAEHHQWDQKRENHGLRQAVPAGSASVSPTSQVREIKHKDRQTVGQESTPYKFGILRIREDVRIA